MLFKRPSKKFQKISRRKVMAEGVSKKTMSVLKENEELKRSISELLHQIKELKGLVRIFASLQRDRKSTRPYIRKVAK